MLSCLDPILTRAIGIRADQAGFVRLIAYGLLLIALVKIRPAGSAARGLLAASGRLRGQAPGHGRVEMVQDEGWRPKVSESVAALAEAEEAYLEHGTTVVGVGATRSVGDDVDPEVARERLWEQAPVILEVQNLSKRFGGIVAADELSMTLRKGTITALVGPNGAGKTTVFNLLTGFIKPDAGSVKLNGDRARRSHARSRRPGAGWCARSRTSACSSGSAACRTCRWRCRTSPASASCRCSSSPRRVARRRAADHRAGDGVAAVRRACTTSPACRPARCRTASRS